jgi:YD repeat-containing protein
MQDGSGICAYSYDAAGRIVTERSTIAGITKTISYAYNLDGSLKSVTYPSGRIINYTVGNAERVLQATDAGTGAQYALTASYAPMGALSTVIYGKVTGGFGGVTEARAYNNRLEYSAIQATSTAGTALNLGYNFTLPGGNNGSVASITNNADNGRTQNFTYDPLNRIGSAMSQAISGANCWGQGFTIDTVANLTAISSQQCSSGTLSVTVDPATNHITTTGFSYDGAGNSGFGSPVDSTGVRTPDMTADGSGYTYTGVYPERRRRDAENRITSATGMAGGPWN